MAQNGHGLAWLPERLVAAELADGRLLRAAGEAWQLDLEIRAWRALNNDRPARARLWQRLTSPR
jgi:DNA-binding transcriptional LysR family regulator